jgi:hypothetical protein
MKGDRFSAPRKVRQSELSVLMLEQEYHFPKPIPFVYDTCMTFPHIP